MKGKIKMISEKKDYIDLCMEYAKSQLAKQQKHKKNAQKRGNIQFLMPKAYKKRLKRNNVC